VRAQWAVYGTDEAAAEPTDEAVALIFAGDLPWAGTQGAAVKVYAARFRLLTAESERTEEERVILGVEQRRLFRHFELRQEGITAALARIADRQAVLAGSRVAHAAAAVAAIADHPRASRGEELEEAALLAGRAALLRLSARRWRLIEADARKRLNPATVG
jgi:hypothetical protein